MRSGHPPDLIFVLPRSVSDLPKPQRPVLPKNVGDLQGMRGSLEAPSTLGVENKSISLLQRGDVRR